MRVFVFIFLSVFLLLGCSEKDEKQADVTVQKKEDIAILQISDLVNKTKEELASNIGNPKLCDNSKNGEKCTYEKFGLEVVFINGKSDWITINTVGDIPFSDNAIKYLGLSASLPMLSNENLIKYENVGGLKEINVFPQGKKVWYFYIKSKTN